MESYAPRAVGRIVAASVLTDAELNEVGGGRWPFGSADTMTFVGMDGQYAENKADDCSSDM